MRFLCDAMLGKLARDLRLLGYDTTYAAPDELDGAILARARAEARLLLTKDKALAISAGPQGVLLASEDELEELVRLLDLRPNASEFLSRCTHCGTRFPEKSGGNTRCSACGHVYWEGTHVRAIRERLGRYVR